MWKITNQSDTEAEILLYDVIADFDSEQYGFVSAKSSHPETHKPEIEKASKVQ